MRLKSYAVTSLFVLLALLCRSGRADTLTLVSVGGQNAGGYYVYPYNFSIDGSVDLTQMMCLDFNREVTLGETWQASEQGISTDTSPTSQGYRADAWIFSQLGQTDPQSGLAYTNAEVQYAVWDIFDPSQVSGNSAFDSTSKYLASQGMLAATNSQLANSGFFIGFEVYSPTSDTAGWTAGTPQRFLTKSTAPTPEPSTLLIFGTGCVALGILLIRQSARNDSRGTKASSPTELLIG